MTSVTFRSLRYKYLVFFLKQGWNSWFIRFSWRLFFRYYKFFETSPLRELNWANCGLLRRCSGRRVWRRGGWSGEQLGQSPQVEEVADDVLGGPAEGVAGELQHGQQPGRAGPGEDSLPDGAQQEGHPGVVPECEEQTEEASLHQPHRPPAPQHAPPDMPLPESVRQWGRRPTHQRPRFVHTPIPTTVTHSLTVFSVCSGLSYATGFDDLSPTAAVTLIWPPLFSLWPHLNWPLLLLVHDTHSAIHICLNVLCNLSFTNTNLFQFSLFLLLVIHLLL